MRAGIIAFVVALGVASVCQAQTQEAATRLVAGCTPDAAYGVPFGERSDRMFGEPLDLAPYESMATFSRTPNSQQMHSAEIVVELPDDTAAIALISAVDAAASASGRFPERVVDADAESVTLSSGDGSVRLEIGALGRGAYVSCVRSALQQLALDEAFGRVRLAQRPAPPTLNLPVRPAANVCEAADTRAPFVAGFESALQGPVEYASALGRYSNTLQQWYAQQLKDKSDFSDEDDADLAMRTLNDPVFGAELNAGMTRAMAFMGAMVEFADARDAGNDTLACTRALDTIAHLDQMSASTQRQWLRIETLYREEAARRGVTLD